MKKIFLLLMVVVILTTSSFAKTTFSDLPEGHWAKGAVEEMVEQGIISGYTDGTFKPSAELSKIHSLLLLARIAGLNNNTSAATKYASTYASTLSRYSTQYKTDVAYLLGTGVLNESDLDSLIADNVANTGLTREEMAMLVTKVLGKDKEATSKSLIILSNFDDASQISAKMKPYVYYVSSQKYMNGVDENHFAPKMILTRAQAACVLQRIYKLVDITPTVTTSPTPTNTPQATSFVNGTITQIDTSTKNVWIKDSNGNTEKYSYDSKTEFYVNSAKKTSSAMAKKASVSATLSNGNYITIMNISSGANVETTTISGTISTFNTSKKTVTIKKGSKTYTYNYDSDTKFTLNGKSSTYSKALIKNKDIEVTVEDNTLIKTVKVTTTKSITGKITSFNRSTGYVVIEDEDEYEYILMDNYIAEYDEDDEDYYYDADTDFFYNGSPYKYSKISSTSYLYKKDNYVKIVLDGEDITKLYVANSKSKLNEDDDDSSSSSSISSGYVKGYILDMNENEITIEDEDDDEYTIKISSNCVIIESDSTDPEDDLEHYNDYYNEMLEEDDEVLIFTYKKSSKYYTSLIILVD